MHIEFTLEKYYENDLSVDVLFESIKDIQKSMSTDECYTEVLRNESKNFEFMMTERLYLDTRKLFKKLDEKGNGEQFYSNFYSTIVSNAPAYFPDVTSSLATLLSTNLADKIFQFYKRPQLSVGKQPDQLTKPEFDGLQYLSGYVVHKLMRKAKNSPRYKSADNLKIVSALEQTLVNDEELQAQTLISVQTRGGLTAVNTNCQNIFQRNFQCRLSFLPFF